MENTIEKYTREQDNKISKIFHIADIHIRNVKRHEEYKEVFENLYSEIKKRKDENSLIVVAGDIAHSKTEMSPELVDMISEFLERLAELCETIVITGNHDCNLNNTYRLDVISPIVKNLDTDRIHYYRESGLYRHNGVDFVVWSVFDDEENYLSGNDIREYIEKSDEWDENDSTLIGLYHGPVDKATTDVGFKIFNNKVNVGMMDGFDMFLLGDIHSKQTLQEYSEEEVVIDKDDIDLYTDKGWEIINETGDEYTLRKIKPAVKYAGSCIQQNHGESLDGHGMFVWDVEERDAEFVEIENKYGYYTLEIENGEVPDVDDMPENPRLRVKITNTDSADVKRVLAEVRKQYDVSEFTIIRNDTLSKTKTNDRDTNVHYDNVQNVEHQNGLIKDYLVRNYPQITDDIIDEAQDINRELNTKIKDEDVVRNIKWYPKKFEFSNMFSYGEGNVIDFQKMEGVNGLFAPNATGKSSIFDALSFCLFDKCDRTYKADHILNNNKEEFWCKFNFEIDGVDYFIEKIGKPYEYRDSIKVEIDFWKVENGERISLNGEQRRDTASKIRQYLGTYEDFVFTCLSLQGNNSIFTELTQSERKDLLAQLMGLNVFDKLYNEAQDEIRDTSALVKKFKKKDYSSELSNLENKEEKVKDEFENKKERLIDINSQLDTLDDKLENKYNELHSVSIDTNITELENKRIKLKDDIKELEKKVSNLKEEEKAVEKELDELTEKLSTYDGIEEAKEEYDRNKTKYEKLVDKIDKHKLTVKQTLKRFESVKESMELEINDNCDACLRNAEKFNEDYNNVLEELQSQREKADELTERKDELKDSFDDSVVEKYNEYVDVKDRIKKLKHQAKDYAYKIDSRSSKLDSMKKDLEGVKEKIEEYYDNEDKIEENKKIRKDIDDLKDDKEKLNKDKKQLEQEKSSLLKKLGSIESRIETLNEEIKEGKELEQRLKTYEYYLDAVKRDGIPYELISRAIPVIQDEINNILQQIVEFTLNIEVDGKNIDAKIVYEDKEWPLSMASGMERFISGLAIRVSLMQISNLPRPNFITVDEGFGTLDSDNLNSLFLLFEYLKSQFGFVIIISHLESMRDIVDDFIEIEKDDGFSKVLHD